MTIRQMKFILIVCFSFLYPNLSAQTFYLKSTSYTGELFLLSKSRTLYSLRSLEGYEPKKASKVGKWETYEQTVLLEIDGVDNVYDVKRIDNVGILIHKKYTDREFESFKKEVAERIAKDKFYQELSERDSILHKRILERIKEDMVRLTVANHDVLIETAKESLDDRTIIKFREGL